MKHHTQREESDNLEEPYRLNKEECENDIGDDPFAFLPKDKGWAWMCVLGCFGVNALVVGAAAKSFGVLFLEIIEKFNSSKAAATWITALDQCLALILGPVGNMLAERYTSRCVIFCGGILMCIGLTLSVFAPSLEFLYFSYGTLVGIGSALSYAPSIVTVGHYFEKRRALANGISVAGSGVGNFAIPPLIRVLLDYYGLNGALLILAAIILNVCVCGMLMRPISYYKKLKKMKTPLNPIYKKSASINGDRDNVVSEITTVYEVTPTSNTDGSWLVENNENNVTEGNNHSYVNRRHDSQVSRRSYQSQISATQEFQHRQRLRSQSSDIMYASFQSIPQEILNQSSKQITHSHHSHNTDKNDLHNNKDVKLMKGGSSCLSCIPCCNKGNICGNSKKTKSFDFGLLKNTVFLCYGISVFLAFSGYPNLFLIVPAHAKQVGVSKSQIAYLLSMIGLSDLIGRVLFGWFFDLGYMRKRHGYMLSIGFSGIACFFVRVLTDFVTMSVFSSVIGFVAGAFMALMAPILAESLGVEKLSSAFGLCVMFMGSSFLYAPILVGFLADITGTWEASFYFSGSVMLASSLVILLVPLAERRESQLERKRELSAHQNKTPTCEENEKLFIEGATDTTA